MKRHFDYIYAGCDLQEDSPTGQEDFFMERETARQEIRQNWRTLITGIADTAQQRVNGEASYICPICGHGTHGDGLTRNPRSIDGNGLKCFGCGFSGDIIDLYQKHTGADYNTAFSLLANELSLTVDPYRPQNDPAGGGRSDFSGLAYTQTPPATKAPQNPAKTAQETNPDFMEYYRECRERLNDPAALAYLTGRGISAETAAAYWLGYDPAADPAQAGHPTPRIIIPTTAQHYVARSIDPNTEKRFAKMNPKGSAPGIFNSKVLTAHGVYEVFVCEGAFDALSVLEAGAAAIAINSTANAEALIDQLERQRTEATLILCLDNDDAGRKARETIRAGAQRLNIACITADICGQYKDPNEHLQRDRQGFFDAVAAAVQQNAPKPDNTSFYIDALMGDEIEAFRSDIKTGYTNLDQQSGGLYAGLYVVAAISSLGKTTFTHQMADQIAAAGNDVLYFSLEQSRLEMVSKSIARITAQNDLETAVTSLSIRKGYTPKQVTAAAQEYKERTADRMSVIEGNFACNISFIGDYIRRYMQRNKVKPVVIIDYLQILQPETDGNGRQQSTKETVDSTVTALKRLSREQGLTIIAISSVNRANYLTPIDFESLKESGNIEFTADVIWGLQLHCLTADPIFDKANNIKERREKVNEEKAKTPRSVDLVCLKNRYGIASYTCSFEYYPANDLFKPVSDFTASEMPKRAGRRIGG